MEGSREQWGVLFYIGEIENLVFLHTRKISKNFKNLWKFYNFLKIVKQILRFSENVFKFLRNFHENLGKNLENFGNMHL